MKKLHFTFCCLLCLLLITPLLSALGRKEESPDSQAILGAAPDRYDDQREEMVRKHILSRGIDDREVLKAMAEVPRHLFIPERYRDQAYDPTPLPIGYGQTISHPFIVAFMTEVLALDQGDRVLEVGTGSGYQAAVLAEITDQVYTVEIIAELAEQAGERFHQLGYDEIHARQADGYYGWKEYAPYDAIIVTAAAGHVPPPLIQQLKPGGRIVIPVGSVYEIQNLTLVSKEEDGEIRSRQLLPVRFVPLTGTAQSGAD